MVNFNQNYHSLGIKVLCKIIFYVLKNNWNDVKLVEN